MVQGTADLTHSLLSACSAIPALNMQQTNLLSLIRSRDCVQFRGQSESCHFQCTSLNSGTLSFAGAWNPVSSPQSLTGSLFVCTQNCQAESQAPNCKSCLTTEETWGLAHFLRHILLKSCVSAPVATGILLNQAILLYWAPFLVHRQVFVKAAGWLLQNYPNDVILPRGWWGAIVIKEEGIGANRMQVGINAHMALFSYIISKPVRNLWAAWGTAPHQVPAILQLLLSLQWNHFRADLFSSRLAARDK